MQEALKSLFDPRFLIAPLIGLPFVLLIMLIWYFQRLSESRSFQLGVKESKRSSVWRTVEGLESSYYIVADLFMATPKYADMFTEWFLREFRNVRQEIGKIDRLAFIEKRAGPVGMLTTKDLLTARTRIPSIVVRPRRRINVPDMLTRGENIVIVSDVATSGHTILEAAERLTAWGATVRLAMVLFDREEGASKNLEEQGIKLLAMLPRSEESEWPDLQKPDFWSTEERGKIPVN